MRIIVQKFGGTSVATPSVRAQVADRVQQAVNDGFQPVVVVSAMGRSGDPYATDTLITLAQNVYGETPAREMDLLISCGETISTVILSNTLRTRGLASVALTGGQAGIITDEDFGNARILRVDPEPLLRHLREGIIPVVAGFQGITERGDVTTLGRGGSDTTAAALGGALKAEVVEIYTDVDGVKTADPRIVPEAKTLQVMTYDEIVQMAHQGAKVVHPRAVEIAMQCSVPLRVKCTFDQSPGTLVTYTFEAAGTSWTELRNGRFVTGVTQLAGLAQITVPTADNGDTDLKVFRSLADAGISVDLINVSPTAKSFTVSESLADKAERVLRQAGFKPVVRKGCAKVSIVGSGMRGKPGVMASVAEALHGADVRILQTSDSHVTISCLVDKDDMERAVRALHDRFGLAKQV